MVVEWERGNLRGEYHLLEESSVVQFAFPINNSRVNLDPLSLPSASLIRQTFVQISPFLTNRDSAGPSSTLSFLIFSDAF